MLEVGTSSRVCQGVGSCLPCQLPKWLFGLGAHSYKPEGPVDKGYISEYIFFHSVFWHHCFISKSGTIFFFFFISSSYLWHEEKHTLMLRTWDCTVKWVFKKIHFMYVPHRDGHSCRNYCSLGWTNNVTEGKKNDREIWLAKQGVHVSLHEKLGTCSTAVCLLWVYWSLHFSGEQQFLVTLVGQGFAELLLLSEELSRANFVTAGVTVTMRQDLLEQEQNILLMPKCQRFYLK